MNKHIINSIALSACFLSLSSFAGDAEPEFSENHFYVQLELGKTSFDFEKNFLPSAATKKDNTSLAIRLGYEYSSMSSVHFGVELGSLYLGSYSFNDAPYYNLEYKQVGGDLLMVLSNDINASMNVFAKGGIASLRQTITNTSYYNNFSDEEFQAMPEVAAGLRYRINDNFSVTGTVSHIFGKHVTNDSLFSDVAGSTSAQIGLRADFG